MPKPTTLITSEQSSETIEEQRIEFSVWDIDNPRSVIRLLPKAVQQTAIEAAENETELFKMDEQALYKHLREKKLVPTATDNQLRYRFWIEYDRVQAENLNQIVMAPVFANIMDKDTFYKDYLPKTYKIAWLLCPPLDYVAKAKESLDYGMQQLREILSVPNFDESGKLNEKVANLKLKIVQMLDNRVNGMAKQQIEQKTLAVHTMDRRLMNQLNGEMNQERMDNRLKELEKREKQALHLPIIDMSKAADEQ